MDGEHAGAPIFISFATPDSDMARRICDALEARGIDCWISLRDIGAGTQYGPEIIQQIKKSGGLVLVLSSSANRSEYVPLEVERAVHYRLPVFPVRIEDVTPGQSLEFFVSASQWTDLHAKDFKSQLDRLARDIKRQTGTDGGVDSAPLSVVPTAPQPSGRPWLRRYGGFIAAALAVAVFGVLNITGDASTTTTEPDPGAVAEAATDSAEAATDAVTGDEEASARPTVQQTSTREPRETVPGPSSSSPREPAPNPGDVPATELLIVVDGEHISDAAAVETVLLRELGERGHSTLDRASIDPSTQWSPGMLGAPELSRLRAAGGVTLVLVAELQTEAVQSVRNMYTGRAALSVRAYDTKTGRLAGAYSYSIGRDGPGVVGASPMAAASEAAERVAHKAASGLARELN